MLPSEVTPEIGLFDRFAAWASNFVSRAPFFAACLLLVLVWAPSILILDNLDTWQLIINTATTIITFLLVALLQNSQHRSDLALQHKLNAIALSLSNFMESSGAPATDVAELRAAVGVEHKESSD